MHILFRAHRSVKGSRQLDKVINWALKQRTQKVKKKMWFLGKCPSSLCSHPLLCNYFYFHQIYSLAQEKSPVDCEFQFWKIILLKFLLVSNIPEHLWPYFTKRECSFPTTATVWNFNLTTISFYQILNSPAAFVVGDCPQNTSMNFEHSLKCSWHSFGIFLQHFNRKAVLNPYLEI